MKRRTYLAFVLGAALFILTAVPAFADDDDDGEDRAKGKGHKVPEVPIAAIYPAAGLVAFGAYWLRGRKGRAAESSDSD